MFNKNNFSTTIAVMTSLMLWSSAFAGIRAGLEGYDAGSLALFRFVIASLIFIVCAIVIKMRVPDMKDIPKIFLCGFTGVTLYHLALNYGEVSITAGSASMLISTTPIFTAFLSLFFLKEKVSLYKWLGIFISFVGIALISCGESAGLSFSFGSLLVLFAAFVSALYIVLQKSLFDKYSALEITAYGVWAGTLALLFFVPQMIHGLKTASISTTLSIVYLGIFPGALAYYAFSYALTKKSAVNASNLLYLVPILATVFAFVWLGEIPSIMALLGGVITIFGIVFMAVSEKISFKISIS